VLAFPCNQFACQEPLYENAIKKHLKSTYKIEFLLFSKVDVNGPNSHPLFRYLRFRSGMFVDKYNILLPIKWNFYKFLLDSEGNVVKSITHREPPCVLEGDIKRLLGL
jgi:Glutathione peroxidase